MSKHSVLLVGSSKACRHVDALLQALGFGVAARAATLSSLPFAPLPSVTAAVVVLSSEDAAPDEWPAQLAALARLPTVFVLDGVDEMDAARTEALLRRGFGMLATPIEASDLAWEIEVATEKWRTAERLRSRAELSRATLGAIKDGVITVDHNELVLLINEAGETITGVSVQEAVGRHIADVVPLFTARAPRGAAGRTVEVSSLARGTHELLLRVGGVERPVKVTVTPVDALPVGEAAPPQPGYVLVLSDVSEERRLQSQLILLDRLASVGTMAGGLAHELNNPLALVVSNVEYVLERARELLPSLAPREAAALAEMTQALDDASQGAARAAAVVQRLRAFSRLDEPATHGEASLLAIVDAAVSLVAPLMPDATAIARDVEPGLLFRGDSSGLVQALVNLLTNAAQAVRSRGGEASVHVRARRDAEGGVEITVTDNGGGISAEALPRVFDPFFTTRRVGQGMGLGLSIVHTLVARMSGAISAHNHDGDGPDGAGACFVVTLPQG